MGRVAPYRGLCLFDLTLPRIAPIFLAGCAKVSIICLWMLLVTAYLLWQGTLLSAAASWFPLFLE